VGTGLIESIPRVFDHSSSDHGAERRSIPKAEKKAFLVLGGSNCAGCFQTPSPKKIDELASRSCRKESASGRAEFELFSEDLFHVTDFPLHFTRDLFRGATVPQIWVSDRFTRFLFDFAHSFFGRALNFIFCA
jgi:hypothetical protein